MKFILITFSFLFAVNTFAVDRAITRCGVYKTSAHTAWLDTSHSDLMNNTSYDFRNTRVVGGAIFPELGDFMCVTGTSFKQNFDVVDNIKTISCESEEAVLVNSRSLYQAPISNKNLVENSFSNAGAVVSVLTKNADGRWSFVELEDGTKGWMQSFMLNTMCSANYEI